MGTLSIGMRAMVLADVGRLPELREVPVPRPRRFEVVVRVGACGVGLTVRDKLRRIDESQLPRIPGHEIVGRAAAVGEDVSGIAPGDRVITYYYVSCGECRMCISGEESLCSEHPARVGEHLDGGFAEYVCLPASAVMRLEPASESLPDSDLTVACDALATSLHLIRRAEVVAGTRMLVVGAAGGVGIHLVQLARALGADVVGVDLGIDKVEALNSLGVEALDAARVDWTASRRSTIDVAVDFVGDDDSLTSAYRTLAPKGTLVRMVTYRPVSLADIVQDIGAEERSIIGSKYCNRAELAEAVDLIVDGTIRPVVGAVRPLEQINELFDLIDGRQLIGRAAVTC